VQGYIDDILPIYAHHVTNYDQILRGTGPPYELLTLRLYDWTSDQENVTPPPQSDMSVHLVGTEDDMRFVNSEDAHVEEVAARIYGELAAANNPRFTKAVLRRLAKLLANPPVSDL
jgi:hypothetical protein